MSVDIAVLRNEIRYFQLRAISCYDAGSKVLQDAEKFSVWSDDYTITKSDSDELRAIGSILSGHVDELVLELQGTAQDTESPASSDPAPTPFTGLKLRKR